MLTIKEFDQMLIDLALDLSQNTGSSIDRISVCYALFILLADDEQLHWPAELWDIDLNIKRAQELLTGFDFNILNQTIDIDEVWFPGNLFPDQKIRFKSGNTIWVIHEYDRDPFPSNPHAHCRDRNYKLHLGNGQCFQKRQLVHTFNRKQLLKIREQASLKYKGELPPLECE